MGNACAAPPPPVVEEQIIVSGDCYNADTRSVLTVLELGEVEFTH